MSTADERAPLDTVEHAAATPDVVLPYGTWPEVLRVLRSVWPEVDLTRIAPHRQPPRARWLTPFSFKNHSWGVSDDVIVADDGWLTRSRQIVPHRRMQSIGIEQGPLQRRLGLASVADQGVGGAVLRDGAQPGAAGFGGLFARFVEGVIVVDEGVFGAFELVVQVFLGGAGVGGEAAELRRAVAHDALGQRVARLLQAVHGLLAHAHGLLGGGDLAFSLAQRGQGLALAQGAQAL